MIFSLVIFLIVNMFCLVIVEASLSFALNSHLQSVQDGAYEAAVSAARLLTKEITDAGSAAGRTRFAWDYDAAANPDALAHPERYHGRDPRDADYRTSYSPSELEGNADATELLLIRMIEMIDGLPEISDQLPEAAVEFTLASPGADGAGAPPVHAEATLIMRRDYSILAVVKSSAEGYASAFTVTVLFRAVNQDIITEETVPLWHEEPDGGGDPSEANSGAKKAVTDGYQRMKTVKTSFHWVVESVKGGAPNET